MNSTIDQLETIDQQLDDMDSQCLLMVGNILSRDVDINQLAKSLTEIASLPKTLQETVLDSILAKIKAR